MWYKHFVCEGPHNQDEGINLRFDDLPDVDEDQGTDDDRPPLCCSGGSQ